MIDENITNFFLKKFFVPLLILTILLVNFFQPNQFFINDYPPKVDFYIQNEDASISGNIVTTFDNYSLDYSFQAGKLFGNYTNYFLSIYNSNSSLFTSRIIFSRISETYFIDMKAGTIFEGELRFKLCCSNIKENLTIKQVIQNETNMNYYSNDTILASVYYSIFNLPLPSVPNTNYNPLSFSLPPKEIIISLGILIAGNIPLSVFVYVLMKLVRRRKRNGNKLIPSV